MPQIPEQLDLAPTTIGGVDYDLSIYQGDDYELTLRVQVDGAYTDLTGATGLAQIRATAASSTVLATLTMTLDADQTTNPGLLVLSIADTSTDDIPANAPTPLEAATLTSTIPLYYWDFELTFGGEVHTYLRGYVNVYPQVSRP